MGKNSWGYWPQYYLRLCHVDFALDLNSRKSTTSSCSRISAILKMWEILLIMLSIQANRILGSTSPLKFSRTLPLRKRRWCSRSTAWARTLRYILSIHLLDVGVRWQRRSLEQGRVGQGLAISKSNSSHKLHAELTSWTLCILCLSLPPRSNCEVYLECSLLCLCSCAISHM